jgi:hypothetical protein
LSLMFQFAFRVWNRSRAARIASIVAKHTARASGHLKKIAFSPNAAKFELAAERNAEL